MNTLYMYTTHYSGNSTRSLFQMLQKRGKIMFANWASKIHQDRDYSQIYKEDIAQPSLSS